MNIATGVDLVNEGVRYHLEEHLDRFVLITTDARTNTELSRQPFTVSKETGGRQLALSEALDRFASCVYQGQFAGVCNDIAVDSISVTVQEAEPDPDPDLYVVQVAKAGNDTESRLIATIVKAARHDLEELNDAGLCTSVRALLTGMKGADQNKTMYLAVRVYNAEQEQSVDGAVVIE